MLGWWTQLDCTDQLACEPREQCSALWPITQPAGRVDVAFVADLDERAAPSCGHGFGGGEIAKRIVAGDDADAGEGELLQHGHSPAFHVLREIWALRIGRGDEQCALDAVGLLGQGCPCGY